MQKKLPCLSILFLALSSLQGEFKPEEYHTSNTGQIEHAIKELQKLNFLGSEKVLDVGSGDGKTSTYIAQTYIPNGQLVGLDNSSQMIAFASSHTKVTNVSYVQEDIVKYIAPDQYDKIVSFWTLHWVTDYVTAMQNIAQSLKPGGKALICHAIGTDPLEPITHELLNTEKWKTYKKDTITLLNAPSLSQIAEAIEKAKLTIESLEVKKNSEWTALKMIKQNLLSLPIFDFIPSNMRAEFCDEVLQKAIIEYPLNEQGEIFNWLPVVVMVLKK